MQRQRVMKRMPLKDKNKTKKRLAGELTDLRSAFAKPMKKKSVKNLAELNENENLFRDLFENALDLIQFCKPNGSFLFVNAAWEKTLGYSKKELHALKLWDIIHQDSLPHCKEMFAKALSGEKLENVEAIFMAKNGNIIYVEGNTSIYFQNGKPLYTRSIFRDITKRKHAEQALQAEKEKAQQYFDVAEVLMIVIDANFKISLINRKGAEILGYEKEKLIGKDWFQMCIPGKNRKSLQSVFKKILSGDKHLFLYYENPVVTKGGREKTILWRNSLIKDKDGRITGVLSSGSDISIRKEIEDALYESEEKFRVISATARDGIVMIDDRGHVEYWNKAAEEIFEYPTEEITGKDLHRVLAPKRYHKAYRKGIARFRSHGQGNAIGKTLELHAVKKSGKEIPVELSLSAVHLKNRWHAVGIIRDITRRKQLEGQLQYLAVRDELTGLYNRRGFIDIAEQQIKLSRRTKNYAAVTFIDLDGMKQINDEFGHSEGDRALGDMANILKDTFRDSDIIGRLGGDEFVVLMIRSSDFDIRIPLSRLHKNIEEFNAARQRPYELSISTGTALYDPTTKASVDELLNRADELMYRQKQLKKSGVESIH